MAKLKILVLAQNYPSSQRPYIQPFIHTRLKEYLSEFDVTVLNFDAHANYEFEGIKVISEEELKKSYQVYDLIISHAPNLRNHIRFLLVNIFAYKAVFFVFHGHEIIDLMKRIYSQKTLFKFEKKISRIFIAYNTVKLPLLKFCLKLLSKIKPSHFIFVSQSLLREAREDIKDHLFFKLGNNSSVINNPINPLFYESYQTPNHFLADFVCIRPFNEPKYGVDIFIELAKRNPLFNFHLYGQGDLPQTDIPSNLSIFKSFINPNELPALLRQYKAAILPTRWDSQGVLACEIAAMGMPMATSKLPVCEEFLQDFTNVRLISNQGFHELKIETLLSIPHNRPQKIFTRDSTIQKEIDLIRSSVGT